jgi:hypothetical protein
MKTTRLFLVMALLGVALVSFSQDFRSDRKGSRIYLTVDQAVADRGLTFAMYRQIDRTFLNEDHPGLYIARVEHNRNTYVISGTRERWINFFTHDRRRTERRPDNEN